MLDTSELTSQFEHGQEVTISLQYPSEPIMTDIYSLISKILLRLNKPYLLDTIITISRELILNAAKANAKRVYFKNKKLDINNPDDYALGIKKFRTVVNSFEKFKKDIIDDTYIVQFKMKQIDDSIKITIRNNAPIVPIEINRITKRVTASRECENFSTAYNEVFDNTEGAGLGLILVFFLLKNANIPVDSFKINHSPDEVVSSLLIPLHTAKGISSSSLKEKITSEIQSLPTFPQHIIELQDLCNNPESDINQISNRIAMDPSLSADILKISNTAGFISGKRIESINEAIMVIGLNNVQSILTVAASRTIIEKRYKRYEEIWEHCNKTAFYARNLAADTGFVKFGDRTFIAGLLHDIGRIVLLSISPKLSKEILNMLHIKNPSSSNIIEELTIGISHTDIGADIAKKWNFPDYLIESLQYHHTPLLDQIKHKEIIDIVYLANIMANVELNKVDYPYIENHFIQKFKFNSIPEVESYHKRLIEKYQSHSDSVRL